MRFLRPLFALVTAGTWIGCALDFAIGPPAGSNPDAAIPALDGASSPDSAVNRYGERVTHDLVALWDFEEREGSLVNDRVRAIEPVLDLKIDNPGLATWETPHALSFVGRTWALSGNVGKKLIDTSQRAGAITVEAWIAPALAASNDSLRVVVAMAPNASFGSGTNNARTRAFALGIGVPSSVANTAFDAGTVSDAAAFSASMTQAPSQSLYGGTPAGALTHLVAVRCGRDASLTLYVDAVNVGVLAGAANPTDWPQTYPVILGNLFGGGASFLGDMHLVAIYRVALSAEEVRTNFLAGADPP